MHKAIDFVRTRKSQNGYTRKQQKLRMTSHTVYFRTEPDNNLVLASFNASVCTCQLRE